MLLNEHNIIRHANALQEEQNEVACAKQIIKKVDGATSGLASSAVKSQYTWSVRHSSKV